MNKNYLSLDQIECYRVADDLSNEIWNVVMQWNHFAQNSVGIQMVKAVDSISANIAEGFGRYTKKDKVRFYRIAMGSLMESKSWLSKSARRNLITGDEHRQFKNVLDALPKSVNQLIKFTNERLKF